METTIDKVKTYVINHGVTVRSVHKLKLTGNIMSVKLIVNKECSNLVQKSDFWPDGITCRIWINNERW